MRLILHTVSFKFLDSRHPLNESDIITATVHARRLASDVLFFNLFN